MTKVREAAKLIEQEGLAVLINTAITLGIILLEINLHYKVQNSYTQREFMLLFNEKT